MIKQHWDNVRYNQEKLSKEEITNSKKLLYRTLTKHLDVSKQSVYQWLTKKSDPSYKHLKQLKAQGIDLL